MSNHPIGILPLVDQPWGFDGVRRETRGAYGDSRAFYVNKNHVEATDDNSGEDPAHPLATIQAAVNKARAYMGDVIYVMGNEGWQYGGGSAALGYAETVVIPETKGGIALIGVGRGSMGVYWTPAAAAQFALTIEALDVLVEGFCFWGAALASANGIFCNWNSLNNQFGENSIIRHNTFTSDLDIGIQLEYTWFMKIYDNHFQGCQTHGIFVDPLGNGIAFVEIVRNWFDNCVLAMALDDADNCLIKDNVIYNALAQSAAVATDVGIDTSAGSQNMVVNNYFSCLLPVPANGDWDDMNSASATDAWVGNLCMNGLAVSNPT